MWFIFLLLWLASGLFTCWYVDTRILKKDIKTDELPMMVALTFLGGITVLIGSFVIIGKWYEKLKYNPKVVFRAKV